ncbi:MAG TPA: alanine racemase [Acidobacteriaceae bacterium]|nr:alanine racemase [Acidobacteriaceae bacterium]
MTCRPVWAEISRSKLLHNFDLLRRLATAAELLAVVKADAYGHGTVACSQLLAASGAKWLGVTDMAEGVRVRAACAEAGADEVAILAMGGLWPGEAEAALTHGITPVVWEKVHLEEAAGVGRPMAVHLEIDTGMSRQGVRMEELPAFLDKLQETPQLRLDGVMTHFHSPETLDGPATAGQFSRFVTAMDTICGRGLKPRWVHAGNSATLLAPGAEALAKLAEKHGATAMIRPGLALYGYAPRFTGGAQPKFGEDLKPVLAWKTRVASLRTIAKGETAGYCATFRAERTTRLALLPVGYADGLNRLLSNRGAVLVGGHRAPIAGRISMDLTSVDVTDVPGVAMGDEVVLIGEQGSEAVPAYEQADLVGTIPYEILCNINARVARVMVDQGL